MAPDIILKVEEEIARLVKTNFIRPIRYVEWLSNIVHVLKKNDKLKICVDFRNLNNATPKDEYPNANGSGWSCRVSNSIYDGWTFWL
jgi:hypothetical protein